MRQRGRDRRHAQEGEGGCLSCLWLSVAGSWCNHDESGQMGAAGGVGGMDVRHREGRSPRVGGPVFDLVRSKMRRPLVRPGTVRRPLLERLAGADGCPVVSVVAPAGYGKTTLLAQWAEGNCPAFAWVSVRSEEHTSELQS